MSKTARIPLFGSYVNRNAGALVTELGGQQFINCFPIVEKNPISGVGRVYLNKRIGTSLTTNLPNNIIGSYAAMTWTGTSTTVVDGLFSFSSTASTSIYSLNNNAYIGGTVTSARGCTGLTETVVATSSYIVGTFPLSTVGLLNVPVSNRVFFYPEGGSWTLVTSASFPVNSAASTALTTFNAIAHLNGFAFFACQNGQIWNSDLNSITNYTANSFTTAQTSPDGLVGIAKYKNLIVAFGRTTTEFFQNTGNATGSPLTVIENATIRIGAISSPSQTIFAYGDTVYWLGVETESGAFGFYRLNGYQAQKISTRDIDNLFNTSSVFFGIAGVLFISGTRHIVLTSASSPTLCYCIDTGMWWLLSQSPVGPKSIVNILTGVSYFNCAGMPQIYSYTSTYQDASTTYTATIRTASDDQGTFNQKFYDRIAIIGDRAASTTTSLVSVGFSDDEYATSTLAGTIDMASANPFLTRLASSRRRSWQLEHSANLPLRVEYADIRFTIADD